MNRIAEIGLGLLMFSLALALCAGGYLFLTMSPPAAFLIDLVPAALMLVALGICFPGAKRGKTSSVVITLMICTAYLGLQVLSYAANGLPHSVAGLLGPVGAALAVLALAYERLAPRKDRSNSGAS